MRKAKLQAATLGGNPDDIEAAFYNALRQGDIERLMACWADEEEIVCVHPGGPRLIGSGAIRATFEAMFANGTVQAHPTNVHKVDSLACPERYTFEAASIKKSLASYSDDVKGQFTLDWCEKMKLDDANKVTNPEWQRNNLEYALRSTKWICDKAKASKIYAQNLYAALCNNDFQKLAVMPILQDQRWHCSWRHAGGVIADMIEHGDYIDLYCSGMADDPAYVAESKVTDAIRADLKALGWIVFD